VSDALYLKAMLMTSPLAVTLGISLTIPLAMAGDLYRGTPLGWKTILGELLVLGSFVANALMDLAGTEEEEDGVGEERERERLLGEEERGRQEVG
jgi:solute carrier family 35 protein F5